MDVDEKSFSKLRNVLNERIALSVDEMYEKYKDKVRVYDIKDAKNKKHFKTFIDFLLMKTIIKVNEAEDPPKYLLNTDVDLDNGTFTSLTDQFENFVAPTTVKDLRESKYNKYKVTSLDKAIQKADDIHYAKKATWEQIEEVRNLLHKAKYEAEYEIKQRDKRAISLLNLAKKIKMQEIRTREEYEVKMGTFNTGRSIPK
jgi:hypothetical protein